MQRRTRIGVYALLLLAVLVPYAQVVRFDFVGIDDRSYVTRNPYVREGLTPEGWRWAWTTGHMANWHPLTWLSHMLDSELFGLEAGGHHATNVVLHTANTFLLFSLLRRATGAVGRSAVAAALFAAHPLRVESVAWVAERKDVLSGLFGLLALHGYLAWTRRGGARRLALTTGLLGLSLLSKPTWVSFPVLCGLLDLWPLARWGREKARRLLLEKLPFVVLALESSLVTLLAQQGGGTLPSLHLLSLGDRIANGVVSYARYLGMTLWPLDLSPHHVHPQSPGGTPWSAFEVAGAILLLGVVSACVIRLSRLRYLPSGWLWFGVSLLPMIGVVQVGSQALADRYTYLPAIGLTWMLVWGAHDGLARVAAKPATRRRLAIVLAGAALFACIGLSARQVAHWRDSISLYEYALSVERDDPLILNNLGEEYRNAGRLDEAAALFREAIAIDPNRHKAYNNLALVLHAQGRSDEAIEALERSIELAPGEAVTHTNLGMVHHADGRLPEAIEAYREALRLRPGLAAAHNNLGVALEGAGRTDAAFEAFARAVELDSHYPDGLFNLGRQFERQGDAERAAQLYRSALSFAPDHRAARVRWVSLLRRSGRASEALASLREALARDPDWPTALAQAADLLLVHPELDPNGLEQALEWASRAVAITERRNAQLLRLLGAIEARRGDYEAAGRAAEQARAVAEAAGDAQQSERARRELEAYRAGRLPGE